MFLERLRPRQKLPDYSRLSIRDVLPEEFQVARSLLDFEPSQQFEALIKVFKLLKNTGQETIQFDFRKNECVVQSLKTRFSIRLLTDSAIRVEGAIGGDFNLTKDNLALIGDSFSQVMKSVNAQLKELFASAQVKSENETALMGRIPLIKFRWLAQKNISPEDFAATIATLFQEEFRFDRHIAKSNIISMAFLVFVLIQTMTILKTVENPTDFMAYILVAQLFFAWGALLADDHAQRSFAEENQWEIFDTVNAAYQDEEPEDKTNPTWYNMLLQILQWLLYRQVRA